MRLRGCRQSAPTLVLSASWEIAVRWKSKGRGRPLCSFRVSFRRSLEMSFELSFQKSFDASFRLSFEASDARSNALNFETSDARSDVKSNEMSNGRSDEVSFRVSVLRCLPANSETSFLASFQRRFAARIQRRFLLRVSRYQCPFPTTDGRRRTARCGPPAACACT